MARQKKPADAVQFTRESAQRIAGVVRRIETSPSAGVPLTFRKVIPSDSRSPIKMATFSGPWDKDTAKQITVMNSTATVMAYNVLFPHCGTLTPTRCVIAKGGTAWYLVNVEHSDASLVTDAHLTPNNLEFDRVNVAVIQRMTATIAISVATCATSSSSA